MPIQVVCPGCKKRFQVSEKFAGKEGPCPSCKTKIKIPEKNEEVVIHGGDQPVAGTKAAKTPVGGPPTFKPIRRKHWTASPITVIAIVAGVLVTLVVALFIRVNTNAEEAQQMWLVPMLGAIVLAFPLSWGGYLFLSDPELATYRGTALYMRVGACAVVYALLWGAWAFLRPLWGLEPGAHIPLIGLLIIVPSIVGMGAIAPFAALDFEYMIAACHYGIYLGVTVLLRLIIHLPAF